MKWFLLKVVTTLHKDIPFYLLEKVCLRLNHCVFGCGQGRYQRTKDFLPDKKCMLLNNAIRISEKIGDKAFDKKVVHIYPNNCVFVSYELFRKSYCINKHCEQLATTYLSFSKI